jgi:hypothetical protein
VQILLPSWGSGASATCSGWYVGKDPSQIYVLGPQWWRMPAHWHSAPSASHSAASDLRRRTHDFDGSKMMVMMGIDGDVLGESKKGVRVALSATSDRSSVTSFRASRKIPINPHHHHHEWNFHVVFSTHHVAAPPLLLG